MRLRETAAYALAAGTFCFIRCNGVQDGRDAAPGAVQWENTPHIVPAIAREAFRAVRPRSQFSVRLLYDLHKHRDASLCFILRAIYRAQSLPPRTHALTAVSGSTLKPLPRTQQQGCRDVFVGVADLQLISVRRWRV